MSPINSNAINKWIVYSTESFNVSIRIKWNAIDLNPFDLLAIYLEIGFAIINSDSQPMRIGRERDATIETFARNAIINVMRQHKNQCTYNIDGQRECVVQMKDASKIESIYIIERHDMDWFHRNKMENKWKRIAPIKNEKSISRLVPYAIIRIGCIIPASIKLSVRRMHCAAIN